MTFVECLREEDGGLASCLTGRVCLPLSGERKHSPEERPQWVLHGALSKVLSTNNVPEAIVQARHSERLNNEKGTWVVSESMWVSPCTVGLQDPPKLADFGSLLSHPWRGASVWLQDKKIYVCFLSLCLCKVNDQESLEHPTNQPNVTKCECLQYALMTNVGNMQMLPEQIFFKKFRIQETPNLSTNADRSNNIYF